MDVYTDGHRAYLEDVKRQIVEVCKTALRGEIGVIETSRKLRNLHYQFFSSKDDNDFLIFIGIESETDDLPVGDERQYWNKSSLIEKDREIAEYESKVKEEFLEGCKKLIGRFLPDGETSN